MTKLTDSAGGHPAGPDALARKDYEVSRDDENYRALDVAGLTPRRLYISCR